MPLQLIVEAQQVLAAQRVNLAAAALLLGLSAATTAAVREEIAAAFVNGFRLVIRLAVSLAITSAVTAALMLERHRPVTAETSAGRR